MAVAARQISEIFRGAGLKNLGRRRGLVARALVQCIVSLPLQPPQSSADSISRLPYNADSQAVLWMDQMADKKDQDTSRPPSPREDRGSIRDNVEKGTGGGAVTDTLKPPSSPPPNPGKKDGGGEG